MIIGGVAGTAHGSVRTTLDLDVCSSRHPASLNTLVAALAPLHLRLRGAPEDFPFKWDARTLQAGRNFTSVTDLGPIGLLGEVAGVGGYEDAVAVSEVVAFADRQLRVLTLEPLIRAKRAAGRERDLEHLMELEALYDLRPPGSQEGA